MFFLCASRHRIRKTQRQQATNASPAHRVSIYGLPRAERPVLYRMSRDRMDLQRASVPTRNQYDRVRQIQAVGNFHKAIWLLRNKTTGQLAVRKEFDAGDVASGFAAREISHVIRLSNCANICTYREHELNLATGTGALVMNVYAYGDLWALLEKHINQRKRFHEGFIWHVFRSLAQALRHMQRGDPPVLSNTYDWIMHRDIYPRNIFLGLPASHEPSWPKVVLGDFGSSISSVDSWQAIELRQQQDFSPQPFELPNNKRSDVYQVGLVIVALCRLTIQPKHQSHWFQGSPAGGTYTPMLNDILTRCLENSPVNRVSAMELYQVLNTRFIGGGSLHGLLLEAPMYQS